MRAIVEQHAQRSHVSFPSKSWNKTDEIVLHVSSSGVVMQWDLENLLDVVVFLLSWTITTSHLGGTSFSVSLFPGNRKNQSHFKVFYAYNGLRYTLSNLFCTVMPMRLQTEEVQPADGSHAELQNKNMIIWSSERVYWRLELSIIILIMSIYLWQATQVAKKVLLTGPASLYRRKKIDWFGNSHHSSYTGR